MFLEKFIRRVVRLLSVPFLLITFFIGVSVGTTSNGGMVFGAWNASSKVIAAENHAFLGGKAWGLQFALFLLILAPSLGLVLYWRKRNVFFRREISRAEEKVQAVLEHYTLLQAEHDVVLETVSDLVLLMTPDQKITWVNQKAEIALGMENSAIIGRSCHEIWHTLIGDGFLCPGRKCIVSGVPERSIGWTREKKQFDIRAVPVRDSCGNVVRIIEIGSDITASNRLEKQLRHLQKMESIGWLTTGLAHDFNNILTGIIGFAYLLQKKVDGDDRTLNYLANIITAGERAEILTRTFLAFTRNQSVSMVPGDLNDVIRNFETLLARILGEDIGLRLALSGSKIPVFADNLLLGQVLVNIAIHCRHGMSAGDYFVIKTSLLSPPRKDNGVTRAVSGESACIQIEVSRGGVSSRASKALQEFFSSTVSFGEGVDLGLAVTRGIVELHGGSITFSAETGTSGVFTVHLPLFRKTGHGCRKETASTEPSGGNETILVVEDDKWARSFFRELLEGFGYGIIEAEDAGDALEKFRKHGSAIALVLCDMVLPKMHGRELCQELAVTRPDLKVLYMSGYPSEAISARGIPADDITILSKPFKPEELLHAVWSVLHGAG